MKYLECAVSLREGSNGGHQGDVVAGVRAPAGRSSRLSALASAATCKQLQSTWQPLYFPGGLGDDESAFDTQHSSQKKDGGQSKYSTTDTLCPRARAHLTVPWLSVMRDGPGKISTSDSILRLQNIMQAQYRSLQERLVQDPEFLDQSLKWYCTTVSTLILQ